MEENFENLDSQNQDDADINSEVGLPADPVEVEPHEDAEESVDVLKQRNQELYEQLKKAKGFVRDKEGKWVKKEQPKPQPVEKDGMAGITTEELYSLVKANVPDEDTNEVKLWARSHGVNITEALKTTEVKSLLKARLEVRRTQEASNTSTTGRSQYKVSSQDLLDKAEKGEAPDMKNIDAYIAARQVAKGKK